MVDVKRSQLAMSFGTRMVNRSLPFSRGAATRPITFVPRSMVHSRGSLMRLLLRGQWKWKSSRLCADRQRHGCAQNITAGSLFQHNGPRHSVWDKRMRGLWTPELWPGGNGSAMSYGIE